MTVTQYPRFATPADLPRLVQDDRVTWSWPPPGTTVQRLSFPELWIVVRGDADAPAGWWFVTTLSQVAQYFPEHVEQVLTRAAQVFTGPIAAFAGSVGALPIIYEVGRSNHMRWISSVFRGSLGGVEEFQYGINFGVPGNDPDPNEAECLTFAEYLRAQWAVQLPSVTGGSALGAFFPSTTLWTEVGVTKKTQTEGTAADGTGGNLEQAFDTQWAAYSVGAEPKGTGGTTSLPYEVACAVTLQTDKRGPSGRGRLYLPAFITSAMDPLGVFQANVVTRAGAAFGRLFDSVQTDKGWVPVVVSRRRFVLNEVKSITVGKVPDAQRRRRRSQDEARVAAWTT
jgi:hypothetical protein